VIVCDSISSNTVLMMMRLSILLTFVSLAIADQDAISQGQNTDNRYGQNDNDDADLNSGCALQYYVANVTVCQKSKWAIIWTL